MEDNPHYIDPAVNASRATLYIDATPLKDCEAHCGANAQAGPKGWDRLLFRIDAKIINHNLWFWGPKIMPSLIHSR